MVSIDTTLDETYQQVIDRFWETIPPVWHRIRGNVRTIATENSEISVEQFHILRHIRKGCGSVSELAEARQISRPAISQAVEALVAKGLIDRQHSTADRRFVQLELTEAGNELLNTIFQKNREWMMIKLETLPLEDANTLLKGMEILKQLFDDSNA